MNVYRYQNNDGQKIQNQYLYKIYPLDEIVDGRDQHLTVHKIPIEYLCK